MTWDIKVGGWEALEDNTHHGGTETRTTAKDWVKAEKQTLPLIIADATDQKEPPRRQRIKFFDNSRRMTRDRSEGLPPVSTVPLAAGFALCVFGLQRQWSSSAALWRISGAAGHGMQELRPLFFQSQEFKMDAGLVPAQSAADFCCGFAAAVL